MLKYSLFCELQFINIDFESDVNEKKESSKFEILAVKDDHYLGMSFSFCCTGRGSMNAIQNVRCSQYVNFLWGFVITNKASI